MNYVYAVCEPRADAPTGRGLDGAALRVVSTDALAAVVSDRGARPVHVEETALWAHERVVEDLMLGGAVLPMRFGSTVDDDDDVERLLVARHGELTAALRRVDGAVELGVRATWRSGITAEDTSPLGVQGPGTTYLLTRSRRYARARALAERLDHALAQLSRTRVQRLVRSPSLPITAAYLVDRKDVDAFRGRIATLDNDVGEAQIVCTGPWPPYSFSGAQAW